MPGTVARIGLVVVVDELDRAAEQPALGVDVLFPDLLREQRRLAVGASPPVSAMLKPILIGSPVCAEARRSASSNGSGGGTGHARPV